MLGSGLRNTRVELGLALLETTVTGFLLGSRGWPGTTSTFEKDTFPTDGTSASPSEDVVWVVCTVSLVESVIDVDGVPEQTLSIIVVLVVELRENYTRKHTTSAKSKIFAKKN